VGKLSDLLQKNRKGTAPSAAGKVPIDDAAEEKSQKTGWVSFNYTHSRPVVIDEKRCAENRCVALFPESQEMDAYRVLRTQIIQRTSPGTGNTIMITSAVPGEGKTLTAVNLAVALAKDYNQTAILVDCDLKRQSVHKTLGVESDRGLIDYLLNDVPVHELIFWPGIDKLTIMSGGRPFHESSELLGSPRMKDLIADMKNRYSERFVIFDVPPILAGADALALMPLVDHVIMVVKAEQTSAQDLQSALSLIPAEKVLGLVLNRVRSHAPSRYASYYRAGG
jgi:protein-tyrosine kinase